MYKMNKNRIYSLLMNGITSLDKTQASTVLLTGLLVGGTAVTDVAKAEEKVLDEIIVTWSIQRAISLRCPISLGCSFWAGNPRSTANHQSCS